MPPLARRSWPRGTIDLLLRAVLAPPEEAQRAWRTFTATRDFDAVVWNEMRLIASLSGRMDQLDPDSPFRPRIQGLAKYLWTQTQLMLREAAGAFDLLDAAGIPFIVIKGGAQYAEGLGMPARRVMGDIDILVRPEQAVATIDALTGGGWAGANGESPELLRSTASVRLSTNYRKGEHGDIDVHIEPFHFARRDAALTEALWANARPERLALRSVLVPDPTDSALIILAHAAVSESGDWAIDLAGRISHGSIDWARLVDQARRRGLVPAVHSGLLYLHDVLAQEVPSAVLAELNASRVAFAERLKWWSNIRDRRDRGLVEKTANRLADRLLEGRGYSLIVKDRRAIAVTRPQVSLKWLLGLGRRIDQLPAGTALAHRFDLDGITGPRRLLLQLDVARPQVSRRLFFDVTANGVAIARLRARTGGSRPGTRRRLRFLLPLPLVDHGRIRIGIEARPTGYAAPKAASMTRAMIDPVPFALHQAWVV